jgi:hypothetical protein
MKVTTEYDGKENALRVILRGDDAAEAAIIYACQQCGVKPMLRNHISDGGWRNDWIEFTLKLK